MTPDDLADFLDHPDPLLANCIQRLGRLLGPITSVEDVRQELFARLLPRLQSYDRSRDPRNNYLGVAAFRRLGSIYRDQRALKRQTPARQPLFDLPNQADHNHDLRHDVAVVLECLPSDLRQLALRLQHQTVAGVARDLRLSRTTVYQRIGRIRVYFERAGLGGVP